MAKFNCAGIIYEPQCKCGSRSVRLLKNKDGYAIKCRKCGEQTGRHRHVYTSIDEWCVNGNECDHQHDPESNKLRKKEREFLAELSAKLKEQKSDCSVSLFGFSEKVDVYDTANAEKFLLYDPSTGETVCYADRYVDSVDGLRCIPITTVDSPMALTMTLLKYEAEEFSKALGGVKVSEQPVYTGDSLYTLIEILKRVDWLLE